MCNPWRRIYSKHFFGDLDGDKRQDITEENLKNTVKIFLSLINTALVQLNNCLIGLQRVVYKFNFLQSQVILKSIEDNFVYL